MIEQPESFTREEILAISNTETRRVLAERLGWGRFLEKIGGKAKDSWTDPSLGLSYELVELDETGDLVLRKQSPSLKDESQPWYAEPVHRDLKTAQAARKWQAVVPFEPKYLRDPALAARDCNQHPELSYSVEA